MRSSPLAIEFLGHSTVAVELGGLKLLTDPVLRKSLGHLRRVTPHPEIEQLGRVDAILISHLHHDHLDLPSLRLLDRAALVVVPRGAGALLRRAGFSNVTEMARGETLSLDGVTIEAVEAVHSGRRQPFGPVAEALGFVITTGARTVYFAGDTGLFEGMADLPRGMDVGLVPVWGWGPNLRGGHLDPEAAAEAATRIAPAVAIPIHWGTLWPRGMGRFRPHLLSRPPEEFRERVEASGGATRVVVLQPGERWVAEGAA